jgi:hypothetical protein
VLIIAADEALPNRGCELSGNYGLATANLADGFRQIGFRITF